ncbi:MAG: hypothetical protein AMJ63_16510 [Myxococcales bacterium SG8_38_1]|nr:MAG: hypothetical protein AMJ63_16510 [Myxococcales bacterium SG8_38_1]
MTEERDPRPYLVITVLLDSSARPAEVSRSHGDAYERSLNASEGQEIAGLELVELPIAAPVFKALRQPLSIPGDAVGLYDVFPLASHGRSPLSSWQRRLCGHSTSKACSAVCP